MIQEKTIFYFRAHSHLAQFLCIVPKHDCPCSPVPCCPAATLLRPQPGLSTGPEHGYLLSICHQVIMLENNTENMTDFTDFFGAYIVSFWSQTALSHSWISRLCKVAY